MTRYIAFLRAINVGGHTVKMDILRQLFEELGLSKVETFIASGNVIFETPSQNERELEERIQAKLHASLGYQVATFLRTDQEVASIVTYQPFPQSDLDAATAFNVALLSSELDSQSNQKLMALQSEIDAYHIHEREIYWMCQKKQSESKFSNAVLEKTIGRQSTLRGINTLKKLIEKYPPA